MKITSLHIEQRLGLILTRGKKYCFEVVKCKGSVYEIKRFLVVRFRIATNQDYGG